MKPSLSRFYLIAALWLCCSSYVSAQEHPIVGTWRVNETLSDDTDEAVEAAIIKAGGKVSRSWFKKKEKGRYRGGPEEQEVYDRISYDPELRIEIKGDECWFGYNDGFQRVFHTDGRSRSVEASDLYANGAQDFAMGDWEGDVLFVEGRPRDGGFTMETYSVIENGTRLRAELELKPGNFGAAVKLVRIYDRQ